MDTIINDISDDLLNILNKITIILQDCLYKKSVDIDINSYIINTSYIVKLASYLEDDINELQKTILKD